MLTGSLTLLLSWLSGRFWNLAWKKWAGLYPHGFASIDMNWFRK
jgi:hypothetical protein